MDEPRTTDDTAEVVRAHRFEVVDRHGRIRAVLDTDLDGDGWRACGLRIFDDQTERITLMVHPGGALLSFGFGGNTLAEFGCADAIPENVEPGAYLVLCDAEGAVIARWQASLDEFPVEGCLHE